MFIFILQGLCRVLPATFRICQFVCYELCQPLCSTSISFSSILSHFSHWWSLTVFVVGFLRVSASNWFPFQVTPKIPLLRLSLTVASLVYCKCGSLLSGIAYPTTTTNFHAIMKLTWDNSNSWNIKIAFLRNLCCSDKPTTNGLFIAKSRHALMNSIGLLIC